MENLSKDSNQDNCKSPALAWCWLFISFVLTSLILNSFALPPIDLSSPSCGLPTISECNAERIEKAKGEVYQNLPVALEKLKTTREAFPLLKLIPSSYRLSIADMGSESQWRISNPPQIFPSGKIDLLCDVFSEQMILKSGKRIEFATIVFTGNTQQDVDNTITLLDKFQGCTFLLREKKQKFNFPPNTVVAPEGIVSWNMLMKPLLEFEIGWGIKILLFAGVFALVGAFLALIKQFLNVARKGFVWLLE